MSLMIVEYMSEVASLPLFSYCYLLSPMVAGNLVVLLVDNIFLQEKR